MVAAVLPPAAALALAAYPACAATLDTPIGAASRGGDPYAPAVARTVLAMIEYTRWPTPRDPVVLCVAGAAEHAGGLGGLRLTDGRRVERRTVSAAPGALGGCDVLYLGSMPIAQQRQLTAAVRGRGVLTIAEDDPGNASEAMFVLTYQPAALSFRLNVDAVSRSGLKVDPRVLRVAQGGL